MGLFGLFSRKDKKKDEDALDLALQKAMEDPQSWEAFYGCLSRSNLLVRTVKSKGVTCFATFADGTLPVFSSFQRLLDDASIDSFPSYATVPATEIFSSCPDAMHLNPFSARNKLLNLDETAYASRIPVGAAREMVFPEGVTMLITRPREAPEPMLEFLRTHFTTVPAVAKAYLSLIQIKGVEETPHYLVSILPDREVEDFSRLLPENMTHVIPAGSYVDFRPIPPAEEVDENRNILFYER
jgi:hypothetical protein